MKLLEVSQLTSGTKETQTDAIFNLLNEWNIADSEINVF